MHADSALWSFTEIATIDPARAALLESAPDSDTIRADVISRFEVALKSDQLRIGMEQSSSNTSDLRVVLQFLIGASLYDLFFNANSGYRAQFRRDWRTGLAYNRSIVAMIRSKLASLLPSEVLVRCLSSKFQDIGAIKVSQEQICRSLDPDLSKLWFCGLLIAGDGCVVQLPAGVIGPRLVLDEQNTWVALVRDESDAWLDVKGAFLGHNGLYQPKNPLVRARNLQSTGAA